MTVIDRIRLAALRYTAQPPDLPVWEWAEKNVMLLTCPTPRPGPYSTELTPYVREPLETFRDPRIRKVVLCWGSQMSKTTVLVIGLMWQIVNEPGPVLWIFPNENLAGGFSDERWMTILNDTPQTNSLLPADRRKLSKLKQRLGRALIMFTGSNSPANLASHPVRTVIMDEVDKLAEQSSKEANAVELGEQRTKAYHATRKIFLTSTPTVPDAPIWAELLKTDLRRLFTKCPCCDGEILPVFSASMTTMPRLGCESEIKFKAITDDSTGDYDPVAIAPTVHMECPHCKGRIEEHHKTALVRKSTWRPTQTASEAGAVGYHVSSILAIDIPWLDMVMKFLNKKRSLDGLQGFVNGELAEPWQHQDERTDRKERIIKADASAGEVICRIMTADVQANPPSWFVVREWYAGGHSRLVEWGKWQTFEELDEHRARLMVAADLTGVDSGFEGPEVYRRCAQFGWFAMRGDDQQSWPLTRKGRQTIRVPWVERKFDPYQGTRNAGRKRITELRWSNPTIKDIFSRMRDESRSPVRWEVPEDYATDEYFRHLDGEYKARQYNPKTGRTSYIWKQRGRRWPNHLFDCEAMNLTVAIRIGVLKTSEEEGDA